MQSLRSKLVIALIKNRHLFKGKWKPEVVDHTFSVQAFRDDIDRASNRMKLPKGITAQPTNIDGMHAEWIVPQNPHPHSVLLYIHGGGFISGSCHTHRMHVAKFAQRCGLKALVFDYRLAPEHHFPAAVDDCVRAYQWVLHQGYQPRQIVVGGESAGATLTLSLLLALKQQQIEQPRAAFSISPVTDLSCNAQSFIYNAPNDVAPLGSWTVWTRMYIANADVRNPLLSPQFGNFEGISPLYICVGTHEIHYDDCLALAQATTRYGVPTTLRQWPHQIHAFPLLAPLYPEATQALDEICTFVKNHLDTNPGSNNAV